MSEKEIKDALMEYFKEKGCGDLFHIFKRIGYGLVIKICKDNTASIIVQDRQGFLAFFTRKHKAYSKITVDLNDIDIKKIGDFCIQTLYGIKDVYITNNISNDTPVELKNEIMDYIKSDAECLKLYNEVNSKFKHIKLHVFWLKYFGDSILVTVNTQWRIKNLKTGVVFNYKTDKCKLRDLMLDVINKF